ncbi:outer membrane lipoprotein carrier protein LolA, partial [Paracidovorax avenae]
MMKQWLAIAAIAVGAQSAWADGL